MQDNDDDDVVQTEENKRNQNIKTPTGEVLINSEFKSSFNRNRELKMTEERQWNLLIKNAKKCKSNKTTFKSPYYTLPESLNIDQHLQITRKTKSFIYTVRTS